MFKLRMLQQMAVSTGLMVSIHVVGCSSTADQDTTNTSTTISAIKPSTSGATASTGTPTAAASSDATADAPGTVGDKLGKFRLFVPKRTTTEVLGRAQALARVLGQKNVALSADAQVSTNWTKPLDDKSTDVAYDSQNDVLQVKVAPADGFGDVGEPAAREEMKRVVDDLANAGLIKRRQFDAKLATIGHHKRITGNRRTQETTETVIEYRYFVERRVGGIQVANSPLVVGISPLGKRSSIRIGGVDVESVERAGIDYPSATGTTFARTVAARELDDRFAAQVAPGRNKELVWKGLIYRLPVGVRDAVVEPRMDYRFVVKHVLPDGSTTLGDRSVASFSLADRNAAHETL